MYQQPYLLPGQAGSIRPRRAFLPVAFLAVFALAFCGGGYLLWQRLAPADASPKPDSLPPRENQIQTLDQAAIDDLLLHLRNANQNLVSITEAVKRTQQRIDSVLPALDRNYLDIEKRRLQMAQASLEEIRQKTARAAEELDVESQTLQQRLKENNQHENPRNSR